MSRQDATAGIPNLGLLTDRAWELARACGLDRDHATALRVLVAEAYEQGRADVTRDLRPAMAAHPVIPLPGSARDRDGKPVMAYHSSVGHIAPYPRSALCGECHEGIRRQDATAEWEHIS